MRHLSRDSAAGTLVPTPITRPAPNAARSDATRRGVLVVGSSDPAPVTFEQPARGGERTVIGMLTAGEGPAAPPWPYLGSLDALEDLLASGRVTEVAVCLEPAHWSLVERVAHACARRGVTLSIPAVLADDRDGAGPRPALLQRLQYGAKRALDVIGATAGLVISSPVLLAVAIGILVSDGRPIFFRQQRAGRGGRPFRILKFRTMQREADALRGSLRSQNELSGRAAFKMTDDPRVTRLGRWLRRTSLDEFPQFWNVLRGDMSLVGPRPHPYDDVAGYQQWHLRRLAVKPGVTGLWQVELRGDSDFDRGVRKDLEYVARWSVGLDLKILIKTVPALLKGTGR